MTQCEHCFVRFEAPARSAGGMANCDSCGRATTIPGGTDVEWIAVCIINVFLAAVAIAVAYQIGGPVGGVIALLVCTVVGLKFRLSS